MSNYGLISKVDAGVLEKTLDCIWLDCICEEFSRKIYITEIGVFNGHTARGIREYLHSKGSTCHITGIDNEKDKPLSEEAIANYDQIFFGDSIEAFNHLEKHSQHLIFLDGNHSLPYVIADFFCYSDKVMQGGYMAFHDTAPHIKPLHSWQRMGRTDDPDMCIAVRKALGIAGLFSVIDAKTGKIYSRDRCWEVIFDEADPEDEAGGIVVIKKLL